MVATKNQLFDCLKGEILEGDDKSDLGVLEIGFNRHGYIDAGMTTRCSAGTSILSCI